MLHPFLPKDRRKPLSTSYQAIYDKQRKLGTRALFMGLFVAEWQTTQLKYLQINTLASQHQQPLTALIAISMALLKHVKSLWEVRNQDLHGPNPHAKAHNPTATTSFKRTLLTTQVKELYDEAKNLLAINRSLFQRPLSERLRDSNHVLTQWIHFVRPLVRAGKKLAKDQAKTTHQPINKHFPPSLPPTTNNDDTQTT